ncbi:MAG: YHS domain-containing protein [bacterium]
MLIMGLIAVTALLGTVALADNELLQPQTKCPVMKGKIDKSLFVEYEGKRIYVCCKECIETVKKDPAKYIRELEAGGVTLEKAQTVCPVLGGKIDKKVYADYNGKHVYFCCAGCIEQFKKEPDKYLKKLEAEGVVPEPTPASEETEKKETPKQTCPMMPQSEKSGQNDSGSMGGCH